MRIRWTEPAIQDLTNICDYIGKRESRAIARRAALAIYQGIGSLVQYLRRGRPGRKADTRELVFSGWPYLAVYRIREDVVEVLRILHGAQDWPGPTALS